MMALVFQIYLYVFSSVHIGTETDFWRNESGPAIRLSLFAYKRKANEAYII